jgi:hypothetical protein
VGRALRRARRFYRSCLRPDEQVCGVVVGYAPGTGRWILQGTILGALCGWLYALYLDAAPLPAAVLGISIGVVVGFGLATRAARQPDGPGAVTFLAVLTDARLLILRRTVVGRPRPMRSFELTTIHETTVSQFPVGNYERRHITVDTGSAVDLVTVGRLNIEPVNRAPTSG